MAERDRSAPSSLLQDLESIRNLLDEDPNADTPATFTPYSPLTPRQPEQVSEPQLDIPLLQDIVDEPTPAIPAQSLSTPAGNKPHNPFLPYDSLAKLAAERQQLDRLLGPQAENPATDDQYRQLRQQVQSEAELVLQQLIKEMLPGIEQELQRRLHSRLDQIIREHLQPKR